MDCLSERLHAIDIPARHVLLPDRDDVITYDLGGPAGKVELYDDCTTLPSDIDRSHDLIAREVLHLILQLRILTVADEGRGACAGVSVCWGQ